MSMLTSESVTEGHPDKVADQISDAVLDAHLGDDPQARVACETAVTTGLVLIFGEISSGATVDAARVARQVLREIGYSDGAYGISGRSCAVLTALDEQSQDIARSVDRSLEVRKEDQAADMRSRLGAGDQGIMFGYACDETPELLPLPLALAHRLARRLATVRRSRILPYLRPDGKSQVTVEYDDQRPVRVDNLVISAQHDDDVPLERIQRDIMAEVVSPVVPAVLLDTGTEYFINPTGRFVIGGPQGDAGLTGRKIMVDTYGGLARHGGGAFSGKDPTKVDRSGSYALRHVAVNLVAAGLARRCEVQIAYAIGKAEPLAINVDTFGTGAVADALLTRLVTEVFDLRPGAIIQDLDLQKPRYRSVAVYGHFGRPDLDLPWEQQDRVKDVRSWLGESQSVAPIQAQVPLSTRGEGD